MRNIIKNFLYISVVALCLTSCAKDYELADNFDLTQLPGYVAFAAPGNGASLDDAEVSEADGSVTLNIENPTGTESNISVDYTFGGSAVFGTDFTVAGASASGGTLVIEHKPTAFDSFDNEDLVIELLTDGVADGAKTLTVSLASASNSAGPLAVGRGGTAMLSSANVNIADVD